MQFDVVYMAIYSPRPGTAAARQEASFVPAEVAKARYDELLRLQEKISYSINQRYVGTLQEVLIDREDKTTGKFIGRTPTNKTVVFTSIRHVSPGEFVDVRINEAKSWVLYGKPLISILGPTGVGKTDLAFRLACSLDKANILSVDTGSFYKAATIGTAKPPKEFTSRVRHWFIDILECQEVYSVGAFVSDCSSILQDLWAEGVTPIVVAGTLFYYYALVGNVLSLPSLVIALLGKKWKKRQESTVKNTSDRNFEKLIQKEKKTYFPGTLED